MNSLHSFKNSLNAHIIRMASKPTSHRSFGEAYAYALAGEGKKVRASLVYLVGKMHGGSPENLIRPALTVELIHTYSLVHDDLPCMDNDDLRRGRPTVHKRFDEATALLVGDALLADAFQLLTEENSGNSAEQSLSMIRFLSRAVGSDGMVLGQALDMHWTGSEARVGLNDLIEVHRNKTGKLLGAACALGGLAAGKVAHAERLQAFGEAIGLAFQMIDDSLDDKPGIGKTPGKDHNSGKLTYLRLLPRDEVLRQAHEITSDAMRSIDEANLDCTELREYVFGLLDRNH